jgi:hypothetical protein
MKYLIALLLISPLAMADYLTEDNGAVCSIPDGHNTAKFNFDFNIWGKKPDKCEFPGIHFIDAVESGLSCQRDIPLCDDERRVVTSPAPPHVRPCYILVTD